MSNQTNNRIDLLAQLHPLLWRAHQIGHSQADVICSNFSNLDQQLPSGGWAGRQCIELLTPYPGIGELTFLIPTLQKIALKKKRIAFLNPPFVPAPNVLQQHGISVEHFVLVQTSQYKQILWATEQLIQSNAFGALLAWLPEQQRTLSYGQLRRLQHLAHSSTGLSFLFRSRLAREHASPVGLRLELQAERNNQLNIFILKRKGPLLNAPITIDLPRSSPMFHYEPYQSREFFDAMDRHLSSAHNPY